MDHEPHEPPAVPLTSGSEGEPRKRLAMIESNLKSIEHGYGYGIGLASDLRYLLTSLASARAALTAEQAKAMEQIKVLCEDLTKARAALDAKDAQYDALWSMHKEAQSALSEATRREEALRKDCGLLRTDNARLCELVDSRLPTIEAQAAELSSQRRELDRRMELLEAAARAARSPSPRATTPDEANR